jgi:hypothetical protein
MHRTSGPKLGTFNGKFTAQMNDSVLRGDYIVERFQNAFRPNRFTATNTISTFNWRSLASNCRFNAGKWFSEMKNLYPMASFGESKRAFAWYQ